MSCKYKYRGDEYTKEQMVDLLNGKSVDGVYFSPNTQQEIPEEEDVDMYFNESEFNSPATAVPSGKLVNLQELKKQILRNIEGRLVENKGDQMENRNPSDRRNKILDEEKRLKKLKKQLEDEIKALENSVQKTTTVMAPMITNALARANELIKSNDPADIAEARETANFIQAMGRLGADDIKSFSQKEHPIFTREEIKSITPAEVDILKEWERQAALILDEVDKINDQILLETVNKIPNVQKMWGRDLTMEELTAAIRDTDALSLWTMDAAYGIFSKNGILPQVNHIVLGEALEDAQAKYRVYDDRLTRLTPKVEEEMRRLNLTSKLIIASYDKGKKAVYASGAKETVDYSIFFSKSKLGLYSKGLKLVDVLSVEFYAEKAQVNKVFWERYNEALLEADPLKSSKKKNKAFDERNQWIRKNEHVFDPARMVGLRNDPVYTNDPLFKPYFDAYTDAEAQKFEDDMRKLLGDKEFNKRTKLIKGYVNDFIQLRSIMIANALRQENKTNYDDLSEKSKKSIKDMEYHENPFYSAKTVITGVPAQNDTIYGKFDIYFNSNTLVTAPKSQDHYDQNYKMIQENPILAEFYELARGITETLKSTFPIDIQNQLLDGSVNYMSKSIKAVLLDNEGTFFAKFSKAIRKMWHDMIGMLGSETNSGLSPAHFDFISGEKNYQVNSNFITSHLREIKQIKSVEIAKFQALSGLTNLKSVNVDLLNKKGMDYVKKIFGKDITFPPGHRINMFKVINDYAHHLKVQDSSMDLPTLLKTYANLTTQFEARNNALPLVKNIKNHYNSIRTPGEDSWGRKMSVKATGMTYIKGKRVRAESQYESWFQRVLLDDKGLKYNIGEITRTKKIKAAADLKNAINPIRTMWPIKRRIYTLQEAINIKQINKILKDIPNDKLDKIIDALNSDQKTVDQIQLLEKEAGIASLIMYKHQAGTNPSGSSFMQTLYKFITLKALGLNMASASVNLMEGQMSNAMAAETGEYFTPKNIYKVSAFDLMGAESARKTASIAGVNAADKITPEIPWKLAKLIDRYDIFSDVANDIQHSSNDNIFDGFVSGILMSPNRFAEYMNQGPMIAAMLEDVIVKSNDPKFPDATLLDATEKFKTADGYILRLKPQFDSVENRARYLRETEGLTKEKAHEYSKPYHALKLHIDSTIDKWHGNYGKFRGMKAKEHPFGQGAMMLRTFLPNQLALHFSPEHDNIILGVRGFKGIARSHTTVTALILGAAIAAPYGLAAGVGVSLTAAAINKFFGGKDKGFGVKTGTHFLNDLVITLQLLAKKMIGVPVNIATLVAKPFLTKGGKAKLIEGKQKYFNTMTDKAFAYTGKGRTGFEYTDMFTIMEGTNFTKRDYINFKTNLRFLSHMMIAYGVYFAAYALYYSEDDPDEKGISDEERLKRENDKKKLHLFSNEAFKIASQAASYYDPLEMLDQFSGDQLPIYKFLHKEVYNYVKALDAVMYGYEGQDVSTDPDHKGESTVALTAMRLLVPTALREPTEFGFESAMKQKWVNLPIDKLWWSDEKNAQKTIESFRTEIRGRLDKQGMKKEQIEKEVKKQVPYKSRYETYEQLLERVRRIRSGEAAQSSTPNFKKFELPEGMEAPTPPDMEVPEAPPPVEEPAQ